MRETARARESYNSSPLQPWCPTRSPPTHLSVACRLLGTMKKVEWQQGTRSWRLSFCNVSVHCDRKKKKKCSRTKILGHWGTKMCCYCAAIWVCQGLHLSSSKMFRLTTTALQERTLGSVVKVHVSIDSYIPKFLNINPWYTILRPVNSISLISGCFWAHSKWTDSCMTNLLTCFKQILQTHRLV